MKFTSRDEQGKLVTVEVMWRDHSYSCDKCRAVNIEQPATLALSCAIGAPLLAEELAKRQAPVDKEKRKQVEEWAKDAGTFIKPHVKDPRTKYVE